MPPSIPKSSTSNDSHNSSIAFQVWQPDGLLAASFNAPSTAIAPLVHGFDYINFGGYRWRTVAHFDTVNQYWVVAAERTDLRYTLAENVVLESISPVLFGLPLVGLLIWFIVGQGLKPLRRLADELGNKQADDLSALSYGSSSQELQRIVLSSNKLLERLGHIVEQILDLYRSSPDQYNASLEPVNLSGLVREALAQEYSQFDAKNQTLEFQGNDCFIQGDRFALTTLLLNLLSNASKYTPAGGQVSVSARESGDHVILTVEDSGSGIPEQQHEAVFERFYRVGGDRHQSGEPGCGLGLAIVKHIVESHNAVISIAHSRFRTGTAFQVNFPAVQLSQTSTEHDKKKAGI